MLHRTTLAAPAPVASALAAGILTFAVTPRAQAAPAGPAAAARQAPAARKTGAVLGTITVRRIGLTSRIREGITARVLRQGVGHHPGTARPGRPGNTVLLGHRTTWRAPFARIDELRRGDRLVLRAGRTSYVYRVRGKRVIKPTNWRVLEPVPFKAWSSPRGRYVTLISCHPRGSDRRRLVVVARFVHSKRLR